VLRLKIENVARLPDGGPLSYQADRRGLDIGRDQHLDWTLPDPTRHISSKHCEIRFFDGAYWLYDVSTNGTFVNKSTRRVQSPYKLADGDELSIGEYIISVSVKGDQKPAQERVREPAPSPAAAPGNLWTGIGESGPPINPQELMAPARRASRSADFLNSIAEIPTPRRTEPERAPPIADPWAIGGGTPADGAFKPEPLIGPAEENRIGRPEPLERPRPDAQPPPPVRERASAGGRKHGDAGAAEFIRELAAGANLPEEALVSRDAGELAREIGALLRLTCANLMQLLTARAAAKTLARSGNRTLIKPAGNNPLKFMPTPEEALKIMLGEKTQSYLDGERTIEESFADLKSHQLAVLSAMQQAAGQLLEELSPQAIESSAGGAKKSLLGTNKARLWELFVERWNSKSSSHEHGMLDEFLDLFAQSYDRETRRKD
jgi:type VI secretion system protein ImpI